MMRMKYGWGLMAGKLVIMFVLAIVGMSPMTALFSDGEGWELGMWGVMIIPLVGLLILFAMMLFFFRQMKGGSPMPRKMDKDKAMLRMMGYDRDLSVIQDYKQAVAFIQELVLLAEPTYPTTFFPIPHHSLPDQVF